jgi:hypothetical protein
LAAHERLRGKGHHHVRHPPDVHTKEPRWHHADDGECPALQGDLASDHVISGAKLLAPESMADDSHGAIRRSGLVIGRREHAAAHG